MKTTLLLVLATLTSTTFGQGTFQNLNLEAAFLIPIPGDLYGRVQFAPAFPGWTATVGGVQETAALYNNMFLDSSGISIIDGGFPYFPVIQGNFTAILQAGYRINTFEPADTALAQGGLIPAGTESLQFRAYPDLGPTGSFAVTLGGQPLSLIPLATDSNYTTFGADLHSWAGQTAELRFTVFADRPHQGNVNLVLDSIQFSNQPIPEPGESGLFALGALLLGWRFLWRKP